MVEMHGIEPWTTHSFILINVLFAKRAFYQLNYIPFLFPFSSGSLGIFVKNRGQLTIFLRLGFRVE